MAAQSGTDPATFLTKIQIAPPAQKPWQIADSLMANSPLRDLPPQKYLDAKDRLTVVVLEQARTLNDAVTHGVQEVRQRASGQVVGALKNLEAEASTPPQVAVQERFIDPRMGVAEPGGVPAASGGDGANQRPDHLQSQKPGPQLGS